MRRRIVAEIRITACNKIIFFYIKQNFYTIPVKLRSNAGYIGIANGESRVVEVLKNAIQLMVEDRYVKAEKIAFIIRGDINLSINQICGAYDYIEQEE